MVLKPEAPQSLPSQESLLLDYVKRLEQYTKGRKVVHVRLSRLSHENRQPHRMRIAVNAFESMVNLLQGQMFTLGNADIIFIFKGESADEVESAIIKLQFMFANDSLLLDEGEGQVSEFAAFYELESEYLLILKLAQSLVADEKFRHPIGTHQVELEQLASRPSGLKPLTPAVLSKLEKALAQVDVSSVTRRQSVCAIIGKAPPQPVFVELFVSIPDLRAIMLPHIDLASSRWLFQHLTDTLDRRVLSMLYKNDDRSLSSDFSFNLNVPTLISTEFLKFDDNVKAGARSSIVLELQVMDILSDLPAFMFARDFARECGYKVCVDGVTHLTLPLINRARLGADLVKFFWQPDMLSASENDEGQALRGLLKRTGLNRTILARCDDQTAIDFGKNMGISLFQGRYIESVLAAEKAKSNIKTLPRKR